MIRWLVLINHIYSVKMPTQTSSQLQRLYPPDGLITLSVFTDKPALQLYTGIWLQGPPNRSGDYYGKSAGLALETQFLPDSPNHPEWLPG